MMDQLAGIDLSHVASQVLGSVPLWFIGLSLIKWWFHKNQKSHDELLDRISKIEMVLAASNVVDIKRNVDHLKEAKIRSEARIDELHRFLSRIDKISMKPVRDS